MKCKSGYIKKEGRCKKRKSYFSSNSENKPSKVWMIIGGLLILVAIGAAITQFILSNKSGDSRIYVGEYEGKYLYCYDSDGTDITKKGKLQLYDAETGGNPILDSGPQYENGFYWDYCIDESYVGEFICVPSTGIFYVNSEFYCTNGCSGGVCIKKL